MARKADIGMGFSADTPLGVLLDHPRAKAVVLGSLADMKLAGPLLDMARGLTFRALANSSPTRLPADKLARVAAELEQL